jgi:molybdate/tungstate transport system permease protein
MRAYINRNRGDLFRWGITLLSALVLLFIIAPLTGIILHTGRVELFETVTDKAVQRSIGLTLGVAFTATLIFSIGAIPLAYLMARRRFPGKSIVQGIIDLPVVVPHTAAGIALLGFLSRDGVAGKVAESFGLSLINNTTGIALAMAFVSLPFMINAARDGFAAVPERLEKAAMTLGASRLRVFTSVTIPLAWRSIVSGFIMMFARGMSEFGSIVIIAYHPMTAPVMIFERFNAYGLRYARPMALLFLFVALTVFILFRIVASGGKERTAERSSYAQN